MFNGIQKPYMNIYDGTDGRPIGVLHMDLPSGAEEKVLDMVNYNIVPESIVFLQAALSPVSDTYTPPEPYMEYHRVGEFRAHFRESDTGALVPLSIPIQYDIRTRCTQSEQSPLLFDSVEIRHIQRK